MTQTAPSYTPVCPGDRLVFTCITDVNMGVLWRGNNGGTLAMTSTSSAATVDSFSVRVTEHNSTTFVTTATIESVPLQLNGDSIGCSGDLGNTYLTLFINIAGIYN